MTRPHQQQKDRNRALSLRERQTFPEICQALPVKLTVGNTHKCNLTCPMCFKQFEPGDNMSYPSLGIERFERIAHSCFTEADEVVLTVSGEPLISETIEQELELGGRYGVRFCVTSNGTPLGVERLRRLVLENVGTLTLSLDGATAETFEKIRRGARFDKVMKNIRTIVAEKRASGAETKIVGHMTLMRANIDELPAWVDLMAELGVDACTAEPVEVLPTFQSMALQSCPELANRRFDEARARAAARGIPITLPAYLPVASDAQAESVPSASAGEHRPTFEGRTIEPESSPSATVAVEEVLKQDRSTVPHPQWQESDESGPAEHAPIDCPYAWSRAWINYDGSVKPCCHPGFVQEMGNIDREDFRAIWNGERYQKLRRTLRSGHAPQACRDCYLVALYSTDHAQIPEEAYRADILSCEGPREAEAGSAVMVRVRVRNSSPVAWPAAARCGARFLALSSHWLHLDGTWVAFEDPGRNGSLPRSPLPKDVAPREELELPLRLELPTEPGEYLLELDFVHEGVTWLAQRGGRTLRVSFRVHPRQGGTT
ncbi:MAG: SPASM domain-containing protein [Planctomycetes bacterium]|nr:SPASM domain-containing protein [Planctomycetota bacterium]